MMLTNAEDVEPQLVGELYLLDQVAQPLRGSHGVSGARILRRLRESVNA